ncbi:MAG: hypothetical protein QOH97_3497 [Actinoplanes sp.]|jgi:hypothetical protein|nr:hypothetical protein [Actinoplanes sp.]
MKQSADKRPSRSDRIRARAQIRDWLPALACIVVLAVIGELGLFGANSAWKLFWSLLNLAPALWIVRAVVRSVRRADEYQRLAQLEALAVGFGTLMMAVFTAGLLDAGGVGNLRQSTQIAFIGSTLVWIATLLVKTQRTR